MPTQRKAPALPPVELLPFRIMCNGEPYAVQVKRQTAGDMPSGPAATFDADDRLLTVAAGGSADDLVNDLKAAATLLNTIDQADAAERERIMVLGQVEQLARFIEAALPARDSVARRFAAATAEVTELREPPDTLLHDAMDEFDAMAIEERRRILNGWTPAERPSYVEVASYGNAAVHRVLEIGTGDRRSDASWDYRLDDAAGVCPVRVLLTEGVSKRQVLDALRDVTELVACDWDELVGSDVAAGETIPAAAAYFRIDMMANKKGEAPHKPAVPALAGNRNDEAEHAKPAA